MATMDRRPLNKKTTNEKHQRVDRFVMSRGSFGELGMRSLWPSTPKASNVDVWCPKYVQQKNYASYLEDAFGLTPPNLQNPKVDYYVELYQGRFRQVTDTCNQTWPCVPRDRKYLSLADSILDLPDYNETIFPELLDWNRHNILVAALGRYYHKWSWKTQEMINRGITEYDILCCKFHPKGKFIALGTLAGLVYIHDSDLGKCVDTKNCMHYMVFGHRCSITAVEWSPTGKSYVTGCSRKMICSFSTMGEVISYRRVLTRGAILLLRISPDARYLAVVSVNSDTVCLHTWPELNVYSTYTTNWIVKAIAWHPWRSALLTVGAVTLDIYSKLLLWDVPGEKCREYPLGCNHYYLDTMLFCPKSGELVVSLWSPDLVKKSRLVVMSNPHTAVDQWGEDHYFLDRVRHMIFNSDGTMLATATSEEDLIIWNFLPQTKKKTKLKKFSTIPVYLDMTTTGFSLR